MEGITSLTMILLLLGFLFKMDGKNSLEAGLRFDFINKAPSSLKSSFDVNCQNHKFKHWQLFAIYSELEKYLRFKIDEYREKQDDDYDAVAFNFSIVGKQIFSEPTYKHILDRAFNSGISLIKYIDKAFESGKPEDIVDFLMPDIQQNFY